MKARTGAMARNLITSRAETRGFRLMISRLDIELGGGGVIAMGHPFGRQRKQRRVTVPSTDQWFSLVHHRIDEINGKRRRRMAAFEKDGGYARISAFFLGIKYA